MAVTLGLITFASCAQQIGDRCGEALPPCPSGTECVAGHCKEVAGTGGGSSGGGTAAGTAGGEVGGGLAGGSPADAGEDAGGGFVDAGSDGGLDGGADGGTDAGADAGSLRDAGRVLAVIDRDLYAQPDGGLDEYPRPGEVMTALFLLVDGGELRIPMASNDAGVFVAEHAPSGAWVVEARTPGGRPTYFDVTDDQNDVSSTVYWGRPGIPVTNTALLSFDLTVQPWDESDSLELVSESAGSRFIVEPPLNSGEVRFIGQRASSFVQGPAIESSDDLRISQFQTTISDSGVEVARIVGTASLSGISVPGSIVAATLVPPAAIGRVSLRVDGGFLLAALAGEPGCSLDISEEIGGVRTLNPPGVWYANSSRETSLDFAVPHRVGARASGSVRCSRNSTVPIPLPDGGFERTDAGQIRVSLGTTVATSDHLSLDGGIFTSPSVSAPQLILVDGQTAPTLASQSPVVAWSPPFAGSPNRFQVVVRKITLSGSTVRRDIVSTLYTTGNSTRIPSGVLLRGERYTLEVFGIQAAAHVAARPWKFSLPLSFGATFSTVFVVN